MANMSPITLGLLAMLAYRTYQGKGRLADMLGKGQSAPAGGGTMNDNRTPAQPGGGGGLSDILGSIFGGGGGMGGGMGGSRPMAPDMRGGGGGMGGGLGGMLGGLLAGGAAGGLLSGGLGGLLQQFQQNGQGDVANSWIGRGENRAIAPHDLESAVGRDTVQELADQSGRPYMDVLSELSTSLPDAVDQLTPEGRIPTDEEAGKWV
jgi:uncharacterized protein YidB (DUF937 family)